ncbi:MAG TPA: hypothetical protein VFE46_00240 [Pirellulales bacterium]|jgi:uncharacterized repeat protein (TIGR01451 family)|nr:hypothetical protein [Pirellulales bacterium]
MRSALIGLGLLAAAGLLITTVVHGQVNQATEATATRYATWETSSADNRDASVVPAQATDPFSVARKTQDINFGSPPVSSSNNAPPFNPATSNGQTDSNATGNDGRQPLGRSGVQSIFPNASANQNSGPAKNHPVNDSNDVTTSGPLRSLQQRLTAVRKSPAPGAAPAADMHPPVVEIPKYSQASLPSAAPVVGAPANVIPHAKTAGIVENATAPNLPDIHTVAPSTSIDEFSRGEVSTPKGSEALVSVAVTPAGPVVSEPTIIGRRVPSLGANSANVTNPSDMASAPEIASRVTAPNRPLSMPQENVLFSQQNPILAVETIGPKSISVGKEATYCVAISNAGEMIAQSVTVSVKTPEWSEILGTKTTTGETLAASEHRGEPLIWRLPRLEPHSKEQLIIRLVPRESRAFDLAVQWACAPAASQAVVEVKEPKIAMVLDGPSEILYGQTKLYKLTLSNPGTGDAENVELLLAPVDGGPGAPTRQEIGLIRAGESKPVEVELSARQAGKLSVKATAIADGNLRAEVAEDVLVRRASLKAAVNGPEVKFAGTPANYNVVVSNPGNATSENIMVAAVLPPGAKYLSSPGGQFIEAENKVAWNLPSLRAGAEQELQFSCLLSNPGVNRMQVLSTASNDLYDNAATATNVEALADLKLEVNDPPGPLAVGEEMVYEVHIRNRGSKAAENVDVAGFFSSGIEPIKAQGGQHELSSGQVVFQPIASISAGSEVVLKITARADQPGNHVFRAEVNCPSMGAKLASEETTLFYGDGQTPTERVAARPTAPAGSNTIPPAGTPTPAVPR